MTRPDTLERGGGQIGAGGKAAHRSSLHQRLTDLRESGNGRLPTIVAKLPESVIRKLLAANEKPKSASQPTSQPTSQPKNRIEDDFSRHPNWAFMEDAGWKRDGQHFTRPGKTTDGISASIEKTSQDGVPLLRVFTLNGQPLEQRTYNALMPSESSSTAADTKAAQDDLLKQGYGREPIPLMTAAVLDSTDCKVEYLIDGCWVGGMPGTLGGGKKSLKTTITLDMALSLTTGLTIPWSLYVSTVSAA